MGQHSTRSIEPGEETDMAQQSTRAARAATFAASAAQSAFADVATMEQHLADQHAHLLEQGLRLSLVDGSGPDLEDEQEWLADLLLTHPSGVRLKSMGDARVADRS